MPEKEDKLHASRHSLAHIMATAIQKLWPTAKFGVGPVIDDGFYYDVDLGEVSLTPDDLPKIEAEMHKIVKADLPFERFEMALEEAKVWAADKHQPYKLELLEDLEQRGTTNLKEDAAAAGLEDGDKISFYRTGEFEDLCRGPHVASTGKVGAFKLHKLAGAYWRGDVSKPQLQRVYGAAFATQKELDHYFEHLEEVKKRDHRVLGQELELFTFSDLVGSGLPLFTPKGTVLLDLLNRYSQQLRKLKGFEKVAIPHITKNDLYKKSGHWDKFGEELFLVKSQETNDELVLKPMNCPHHTQIYASKPRSYRDLPVKYMETTTVYRDEKSGELHGLSRVRSITMDDCHAFCRGDQIEEVVKELVQSAQEMYQEFGMELKFRLSFRDEGEGYLGYEELWEQAQTTLTKLAKKNKLDFFIAEGEAAFYGPKIDFIALDALGREWQVATVQLDFVQPTRFELEYVDENGDKQIPVMIHAALLGSAERFLSVYIEHTAGHFPFWLAPEQVRALLVNDQVNEYVAKITTELDRIILDKPVKFNELRYSVDERNESLGKKIRDAEVSKVPVILIVGPKDAEAEGVSVRTKDGEQKIKLNELQEYLKEQ